MLTKTKGDSLALLSIVRYTFGFWQGFFYYLNGKGRYSPYDPTSATKPSWNLPTDLPSSNQNEDDDVENALFHQHARIHVFSLAATFYLFDKPHYRKGAYREDLRDNLRNVAVPGTGLPLSIFVGNKLTMLLYILIVYPFVALVASIHYCYIYKIPSNNTSNNKSSSKTSLAREYAIRLLAPNDWFSFWRLNCNIVGLHALLNDMPVDYDMENKWTFLKEGDARGVPISPYFKAPRGIVVKHRNEEGGMGIFFYQNAVHGGDWIIQERIDNSDWVSSLLPPNAPLSTFRVITQSRGSLNMNKKDDTNNDNNKGLVKALSCVFRAGRQNAATDHDSILFDVDTKTGKIGGGTTNAHWYHLGLTNALLFKHPWRSTSCEYTNHPDVPQIAVTSQVVPNIQQMLTLVEDAHLKMCPHVPMAGWDVVLSADPKLPICLLEVNLSCNFFRGSFDKKAYFDFCDQLFAQVQTLRLQADGERKTFKAKQT